MHFYDYAEHPRIYRKSIYKVVTFFIEYTDEARFNIMLHTIYK
jgi:hypothetical protein